MRVEEAAAGEAAEAGPGHQGVRVREDVPTHQLLLALAFAALAAKLSVESVQRPTLGREFVLVPFDGLSNQFGVHGLEVHPQTLGHRV